MAKDKYHDHVKAALITEGWRITHDPLFIKIGRRKGYIDLGAERELIGAERGSEKIAVEIKSFLGASDLNDFEDALGQFMVYLFALGEIDKDRILFLAMPETYYDRFFEDTFFTKMTKHYNVNIIVYNDNEPILTQWIK
jgi:hypothetical protein